MHTQTLTQDEHRKAADSLVHFKCVKVRLPPHFKDSFQRTYMYTNIYSHTYLHIYACGYIYTQTTESMSRYGVATISRLLNTIGLFCKRAQ